MMRQFPGAFEFDERLLLCVLDQVLRDGMVSHTDLALQPPRRHRRILALDQLHAGRFGTFFHNAHLERARRRVSERTVPLWWWLVEQRERFANPAYEPAGDAIIMPSTLPKNLRFFEVRPSR